MACGQPEVRVSVEGVGLGVSRGERLEGVSGGSPAKLEPPLQGKCPEPLMLGTLQP